uniref:AsIV-cont00078-ORF1 n=1 Tax=Apophua simplicipes ichnovirus TaxID=1329648 RepID=S5DYW8_9VIRU|nr:AsIV-cont00078-ORF1 [Apophua simplicipes ichnovirus]
MENSTVVELDVARDHCTDVIVHEFSEATMSTSAKVEYNVEMQEISLQPETDDVPVAMPYAIKWEDEIETVISSDRSENDEAPDPRAMVYGEVDWTWRFDDELMNLNHRQWSMRNFKDKAYLILFIILCLLFIVVFISLCAFTIKYFLSPDFYV